MSVGRAHFHDDLSDLQTRSLAMFDLVLTALDRVIEALEHQDIELAQIVIDADEVIDATYVELHHAILSLLTLQAPVAGDLRRLAALLHVIRYAERMGAQCVSIAKLIPLSGHEPPVRREILERVVNMGRHARCEVVQCRRAFADGNVAMAEDLVKRDREVNLLNREIFKLAIDAGDDADTREWAMTMTLVARAFERVGDNAVDVGEQTAFVATGLFREFSDASQSTR
jgi:phosphate transport system protein